MEAVLQLLSVLLPMGYLLAAVTYLVVFLEAPEWARSWATRITLGAVGFHLLYLVLAGFTYKHVPMANPWEGFSFIAFAVAAVYLALEWRSKDQATGVFLMVPVLFFQVLSSAFVTRSENVAEILRGPLFAVHVTTALLGYVALSVAAVYGSMYVLLYREVKTPRIGLIFRRLPSLETLSRLNLAAVFLGWTAITLAILLGSIWANELGSRGWLEGAFFRDPKFLLTVALWGFYGFTLGGRYLFRWPNRQVAYLSIAAFVLLLGSSLAVNLFLPSFHRFS